MAQFIPSLETVKKSRRKPTKGELELLEKLQGLSDEYIVMHQPNIDASNPDVVVLKKGGGMMIIEVKDYNLSKYECHMNGEEKYLTTFNKNRNSVIIKSPFKQVQKYKDLFFNVTSEIIATENIENTKVYAQIKTMLYFSNERTFDAMKKFGVWGEKYTEVMGYDRDICDLINSRLKNLQVKANVYREFERILKPIYHKVEDGNKDFKLTKQQKELLNNSFGQEVYIKGGNKTGTSTLLAHMAVQYHKKTGGRVAILPFNITLSNYLKDKVSQVREGFDWSNFCIVHVDQFLCGKANKAGIKQFKSNDKENILNASKFVGRVLDRDKYDAILIDEGQDFEPFKLEILKKRFLAENGTFVVVLDEEKNIYAREDILKDVDKSFIYELDEYKGEQGNINNLSLEFKNAYLKTNHKIPAIRGKLKGNQNIRYSYGDMNLETIFDETMTFVRDKGITNNDICLISSEVKPIRRLNKYVNQKYKFEALTTFESEDQYEMIEKKAEAMKKKNTLGFSDEKIQAFKNLYVSESVRKIRRIKKFNFWAQSGQLKLSTTHSFKGWECDTVVLILEESEKLTDELVYTAITRAKKNLLIYNLNNQKYHKFFSKKVN